MTNLIKTAVSCWGAAVFLFFIALPCFAKDPLLVGKEVEVTAEYLVNLIPYFDVGEFSLPKDTPLQIAEKMIHESSNLKLRADCPADIRAMFEKMNWSFDSHSLEFRDTTPFSNLDEYVAHTNKFIELVKMDNLINNPMKHLGKTRFHFHMSVLNGRDHRAIAERLNGLAILKFIEGGTGDMALVDDFGYGAVESKGLLRLHSPERIEIRNHFISAEGDARELYRLLSQPEEQSRRELSKEIRKRLTPEAITLLARHRAGHLVKLIQATNRDLPDQIALDSKGILKALKKAAVSSDCDLGEMAMMLRDPDARAIAPKIAKLLQTRALEDPKDFAKKAGESYTELLIAIHDALPVGKREFTIDEMRWATPFEKNTGYAASIAVGRLAAHNRAARQIIMSRLLDPWDSGNIFKYVPPQSLVHPELRDAMLDALPRIGELTYRAFLTLAVENADSLPQELLPFLQRGLKKNDVRARLLEQKLHAPQCGGIKKI